MATANTRAIRFRITVALFVIPLAPSGKLCAQQTIFNYFYAEISKTLSTGTRLTAGGYDFTRNVIASANRAGGQFGFEHQVSKRITLAADWFTGKHSAGYFTPGMVFKVGPKVTGYAGYSIGNQNPSRGNHFFLLEVGYQWE